MRGRGRALIALSLAAATVHCVLWWVRVTLPSERSRQAPGARKLILAWVPFFGDPYFGLGTGPYAFADAGCPVSACELTDDRTRVPLERFDALLFHGYEYYEAAFGSPSRRHPRQLYVFMSLESARRTPIPARQETFYNLTMTYRLDSDVPWPYFAVLNRVGEDVAPSRIPRWTESHTGIGDDTRSLVGGKTRPVAWFVSNCRSESGRESYVRDLSRLVPVDVYGACGPLQCPAARHAECAHMVGVRYHFYLALENSLCRDYVTEKAAWALTAGAVPVVRSGADLANFLPPGSYLEADESPAALAARLRRLLSSPKLYARLLRWRSLYRVVEYSQKPSPSDVERHGM